MIKVTSIMIYNKYIETSSNDTFKSSQKYLIDMDKFPFTDLLNRHDGISSKINISDMKHLTRVLRIEADLRSPIMGQPYIQNLKI